MDQLFSNPWVIGIGGGILSGLVVSFISRAIFSGRDNKEYAQKVAQANNEVIYAIRLGISEGVIPSNIVINSLIVATAGKYNVDHHSMHDLEAVSNELIKEVMDSSFISASAKNEFCEKLSSLKEDVKSTYVEDTVLNRAKLSNNRTHMASILSLMAGVYTSLSAFLVLDKSKLIVEDNKNFLLLILPAFLAVIISLLYTVLKQDRKSNDLLSEKNEIK